MGAKVAKREMSTEKRTFPQSKESGLFFGADYNPEQWDRSVWLDDVRLMREVSTRYDKPCSLEIAKYIGWCQCRLYRYLRLGPDRDCR